MPHSHTSHDATGPNPGAGYAVILTTTDPADRTRNAVFAQEFAVAFDALGCSTRRLDYKKDVRQVSAAFADPDCKFFVCFNGFGSELLLTTTNAAYLTPAFEHYGKPLFDLMDDCPIHEDMKHQIDSTSGVRTLLVTDYRHAYLAQLVGMESVRTVSSVAFPASFGHAARPLAGRPIEILLPLENLQPQRMRHEGAHGYRGRVFREIFENVAERALRRLDMDPWVETLIACQEIGIATDLKHPDFRFLLSSIVDHVGAERQRMLFEAIRHLPLTIVADAAQRTELAAGPKLKFIGNDSFASLLHLMADSKAVVCPIVHRGGGRERALAAFSSGALVVAPTDPILESEFEEGEQLLIYRDFHELALTLEQLLEAPGQRQEIATRGQIQALERFSQIRLARTILSLAKRRR
jgi:hypothetical protein